MAFSNLQARMNASALSRLGQDVLLAGVTVRAVFDQVFMGSAIGDGGIASTASSLIVATSAIPPQIMSWLAYFTEPFNPIDLLVNVENGNYKIAAHEGAGPGLSRLILELA